MSVDGCIYSTLFLVAIPGKFAPPNFGPCGARFTTPERSVEDVAYVGDATGCEKTGCARPSRAAHTMDGLSMLSMCY
jgi:hypothetical protein